MTSSAQDGSPHRSRRPAAEDGTSNMYRLYGILGYHVKYIDRIQRLSLCCDELCWGGATVAGSSIGTAATRTEPREAADGPGSADAWEPKPFCRFRFATALGLTGKKQRIAPSSAPFHWALPPSEARQGFFRSLPSSMQSAPLESAGRLHNCAPCGCLRVLASW